MNEANNSKNAQIFLPPCRAECPAHVNVQGCMSLIQRGKFAEAVEVIRKDMPFPAICGRVCFSPCESACSRVDIDQALAIRHLKKIAADIESQERKTKFSIIPKKHKEKVAIIGAGPAGLSAAYQLVQLGYPVTVFERMPALGGMMRYCIPSYRLEKQVVDNEIKTITDLGIEVKKSSEFGKDVTLESLKNDGYKAVFIAIGTQKGMKLDIQGENLEGVISAVEFLKNIETGQKVHIGEKVAVIGGGNSAIDAARSALRQGAKEVFVLYRRSEKEMPALRSEVEDAMKEGVQFRFLVAPKQILGENGKVKAVKCLKMVLGEPDKSGRRRPTPLPGSEHKYDVDTVIPAISQIAEAQCIPPGLANDNAENPLIVADPLTLETKIPGVFAGGDIVDGPASIIEAVAAGKRAAVSIDLLLSGQDIHLGRGENIQKKTWIKDNAKIVRKNRKLEELASSVKQNAIFEAKRCLGCGPCAACLANTDYCEGDKAVVDQNKCIGCNVCVTVCPFEAASKGEDNIAKIDEDTCKGCGICAAKCPTIAISMKKLNNQQIMNLAMGGS